MLYFIVILITVFFSVRSNHVLEVNHKVDKYISFVIPSSTKEVYYSLSAPNKIGAYVLGEKLENEVASSTLKQNSFTGLNPKDNYNFLLFNWNSDPVQLEGSIFFVSNVKETYSGDASICEKSIGGGDYNSFYILENTTKLTWHLHSGSELQYTIYDHELNVLKSEKDVGGTSSKTVTFKETSKPYYVSYYPSDGKKTKMFANFTFSFPENTDSESWLNSYWWIFLVIFLPFGVSMCCYCLICYCCCVSSCTTSGLLTCLAKEKSHASRMETMRLLSEESHEEEISKRNERDKKIVKEIRSKFDSEMEKKNRRISELQTAFQESAKRMNRMVDQLREMTSQSQEVLAQLSQRDGLIEQQAKSLSQLKKQLISKDKRIQEIQKTSKEQYREVKEAKENAVRILRQGLNEKKKEIERLTEEVESFQHQVNENEDQNTSYLHRISKYDEERTEREKEKVSLETKCEDYERKIHEFETSDYEKELSHNSSLRKLTIEKNDLLKKVNSLEQDVDTEIQKKKIEIRQLERSHNEKMFKCTQRAERAEEELADLRKRVDSSEKRLNERDQDLKELNLKHFDQISERDRAQSNISDLVGESMEKIQLLQGNVNSLTKELTQVEIERREIENEVKEKDRIIAEKNNTVELLKRDISEIQTEVLEQQRKNEESLILKEKELEKASNLDSEKDEKIAAVLRQSEKRVAEKNIMIKEKEKIVKSIKKELDGVREGHVDLQMKYFSLTKEKERLGSDIDQLKEKVQKKTDTIREKDDQLSTYEIEIESRNESIEILEKELEEIENNVRLLDQRLQDEQMNSEGLLKERSVLRERVEALDQYVKQKQNEMESVQKEHKLEIRTFRNQVSALERKNSTFEKNLALSEERLRTQKNSFKRLQGEKKKVESIVEIRNKNLEKQAIKFMKLEAQYRDIQRKNKVLGKSLRDLETLKRKAEVENKNLESSKELSDKKNENIIKTKSNQIHLFKEIMKRVVAAFDHIWGKVQEKVKIMDTKITKVENMTRKVVFAMEKEKRFYISQVNLSKIETVKFSEIGNLKKPVKDFGRLVKLTLLILQIETKNVSWPDLSKHLRGKNNYNKFVRAVLLYIPEEHINKNFNIELEEVNRLEKEAIELLKTNEIANLMLLFCKSSLDVLFQRKRARAFMRAKFQMGVEIPKKIVAKKKKKIRRSSRAPSSPAGGYY